VVLRAPGSAGAQRFFVGFVTYGFVQAEFYGGPAWKTWLAAGVLNVAGPLSILAMMHWARRFPDEMPEHARVWAGWPWVCALLYGVLVRVSYLTGWPVPASWIARVSFGSHALAIAAGLAILAWNYGHAFASGRRRLRWILLGTVLGSLPFEAALAAPLVAPTRGFRGLRLGFSAPVWITVVLRCADNAFDATACWRHGGLVACRRVVLRRIAGGRASRPP
jgi:hypothetical protein